MSYDYLSHYNFEHSCRYHRIVNRVTATVIYLLVGGLFVDTFGHWWGMLVPCLTLLVLCIVGGVCWAVVIIAEGFIDWLQGWE